MTATLPCTITIMYKQSRSRSLLYVYSTSASNTNRFLRYVRKYTLLTIYGQCGILPGNHSEQLSTSSLVCIRTSHVRMCSIYQPSLGVHVLNIMYQSGSWAHT